MMERNLAAVAMPWGQHGSARLAVLTAAIAQAIADIRIQNVDVHIAASARRLLAAARMEDL
jgi:hypothetical protein